MIPLLLIMACLSHAAPITHSPIPDPPLQYWHTTYIPTDSGVFALEVYAPALPKLEVQPRIIEIGEPPAALVNVPEPNTGTLILAVWLLAMTLGRVLGAKQ